MNKKILLLNPPYKEKIIRDNYCCFTSKSGYLWPAVDLLYVSSILSDEEISLGVLDAVALGLSWDDVFEMYKSKSFDAIICMTGTVSFEDDMRGLKKLKKATEGRVYVMGNTPAFMPEKFMGMFKFVDGIFHNFFESDILPEVKYGRSSSKTISKRYRDGNLKIGRVNLEAPAKMSNRGFVPKYDLFPLEKYSTPISRKRPLTTSLITFGCPFACDFCIASAIKYSPRSLGDVMGEFEEMKNSGIKEIFFQDSTFNSHPDRVKNLLSMMIENKYDFSWSANIHSYYVDKELLEMMRDAGCHTVQIGVEAGSDKTRKKHASSKTTANLKKSFRLCREVGIRTLGYFILGFPGENNKQMQETIQFALDLDPDFASFSILTPDYGTKLYDDLKKKSLVSEELRSFDSSVAGDFNFSKVSNFRQKTMLLWANVVFYLSFKRWFRYLSDLELVSIYLKNGLYLMKRKVLGVFS